ncbi:phenylalanine--tRNA ligase subunit alpha [bacterium]|nr:phenylalanine--tRNA ligase subunit alpha [bacterium]
MKAKIKEIEEKFNFEIKNISLPEHLEEIRVKYIGRKGVLTSLLKQVSALSNDEKPVFGRLLNNLKTNISARISEELASINSVKRTEAKLDISLPGISPLIGTKHPLTLITQEIKEIFFGLGFETVTGPEIETEYYNFEALNTPEDHPARDEHDSFYITDKILLRTHTSPVQIRVMEKQKPPVRVIAPGRCFRRDATDATHSPIFHQVEGLAVDTNITFGDLKGVLEVFARQLFGRQTKIRFRPDFFPFTEPSAEYAFSCVNCKGKGCRICKNTGWLEIGGAGMVDPEVFKMVHYDAEKYSGFAFGMGIERIAMIKYHIHDIRMFFENDLRFLRQF